MAREFLSGMPGTNLHGLNNDWLLNKVKNLDENIDEIVREKIQSLALSAMYDSTTETLTILIDEEG